jgi:hypothetical protein
MAWSSIHSRSTQHEDDYSLDIAAPPTFERGVGMTTTTLDPEAGRREYILAEFRCALIKAKLAQLDIEAVAIALKNDILTPEQAAAMFWDSEAIHFLGLEMSEVS